MRNWENNIRKVVPYTPGEQPKNTCVIKLNTNENPYPPAPGVKEVLSNFNTDDLRLYPDPRVDKLVNAIADFYKIDSSKVFVGVGSDDVLAMIFMTFFNSKKPVLFPDITYSFYDVWADMLRIPYEQLPLSDDFSIVPSDYYKANGGVVFPNPNAPTSLGVGEKFIRELLENNQDSIVIIDEAYVDFGRYSCVELVKEYDNLVVTQTFSKSRSLAGMRVGMAFASAELISYMQAVKDSYNSYPLDQIAIETAVVSLSDEDYFKATVEKVKATRDRTAEKMREMGFNVLDSETNFLFAQHEKLSAKEIFTYLRENGIFVRYFNKPRIDNFLRITIGTDEEMELMIEKLSEICK